MTIAVLDAPSNLGLRMPAPGVVPGCYKLAGAVRDQRFLDRIGAVDAGCVVPPRYDTSGWTPAKQTLARFDGLDGFWVHVDADVLDIDVMPAVDAPDPGGLDYPELIELLRPLLADDRCAGFQLTIYDPDLDPDGRYAAELTDAIVAALNDR